MKISIIVAISKNNVIGKDNQLIWNLPKDMKFFMDTTLNHPVIMGRKNFESIPEKYRPLKNRTNIIITKNNAYKADGCLVVKTIEASLTKAKEDKTAKEIFVIGGGQIYRKFLEENLVDRMYITHIDERFEGDTFFPEIDYKNWSSNEIINHKKDIKNPHDFRVVVYNKKS